MTDLAARSGKDNDWNAKLTNARLTSPVWGVEAGVGASVACNRNDRVTALLQKAALL